MGKHSWRNFEPEQYVDEWQAARPEDEAVIREEVMNFVEGGRFGPMLKTTYDFFTALDPDERYEWANKNQDMAKWIGVYAMVQHLNTHEKYTGIPSGLK